MNHYLNGLWAMSAHSQLGVSERERTDKNGHFCWVGVGLSTFVRSNYISSCKLIFSAFYRTAHAHNGRARREIYDFR